MFKALGVAGVTKVAKKGWDKAKGLQFMNAFQLQLPSQLRSDASLSKADIRTNDDLLQWESSKKN